MGERARGHGRRSRAQVSSVRPDDGGGEKPRAPGLGLVEARGRASRREEEEEEEEEGRGTGEAEADAEAGRGRQAQRKALLHAREEEERETPDPGSSQKRARAKQVVCSWAGGRARESRETDGGGRESGIPRTTVPRRIG
jgi:hypothetical protein